MLKNSLLFLFVSLFPIAIFALNVSVGSSAATYLTDGSNDEIEIQAAINAVNAAGGGSVLLKNGTYNIQTTYLIPKSNVTLVGESRDLCVLSSARTYSYLIFNYNTTLSRFFVENLTINALNAGNASGIRLEKAYKCRFSNVKFMGVSCGGWHLVIGIEGASAGSSNEVSRNILIENCLFDGHKGSLEMLLIFNTKNCRIENCTFQNKILGCPTDGNRPVVGLWQKTDSISILNCTFQNNQSREAIYHSNTCSNTLIENCIFSNTGGVRGANESDYGTFGVPYERNLMIRNCTFTGGANDLTNAAIVLGAVKGVLIKDCNITNYEEGIIFQSGLSTNLTNGCKHFAVVRTNIRNGNPNNNVHALHPAILFQKVGGKLQGFFICGDISSNLSPPKQEQAVSFTTNTITTFDSLFWLGMNITSYNGRPNFAFLDFSLQGTPFLVEKCNSPTPPTYCASCPTMSDAVIENKIRAYDTTTANILHQLLNYQANAINLPVELIAFRGESFENKNLLTWQTAIEKQILSFEIERRNVQNEFEKIGELAAKGSNSMYQFTDYQCFAKENIYRLKIIEEDGTATYSDLLALTSAKIEKGDLFTFPNPAKDFIQLFYKGQNAEKVRFKMCNLSGQVIHYDEIEPNILFQLNVQTYAKGIYLLEVYDNFSFIRQKISIE